MGVVCVAWSGVVLAVGGGGWKLWIRLEMKMETEILSFRFVLRSMSLSIAVAGVLPCLTATWSRAAAQV
jgi:hypothetical protein